MIDGHHFEFNKLGQRTTTTGYPEGPNHTINVVDLGMMMIKGVENQFR